MPIDVIDINIITPIVRYVRINTDKSFQYRCNKLAETNFENSNPPIIIYMANPPPANNLLRPDTDTNAAHAASMNADDHTKCLNFIMFYFKINIINLLMIRDPKNYAVTLVYTFL